MSIVALNSSPRAQDQSKAGLMLNALMEGMRKAGYELVKPLKIPTGTMSRIMKPMGDFKENAKMNNAVWKTCISEGVTVKEFYDKKLTPRPDSLETFMLILPMGVNSKALGDIKAICHFLCNSSQKKCKNNTSMLFSKKRYKATVVL